MHGYFTRQIDVEVSDIGGKEFTLDTPPQILLEAPANGPMYVLQGTPYNDPGATAFDVPDGDLTDNIQIEGEVDVSTPGIYSITYTVSDATGHTATATRTIHVVALGDRSRMASVGEKTSIVFSSIYHDRRTRQSKVNVQVSNISSEPLSTPLLLVFEGISDEDVTLTNPDGNTKPDGKPYINLANLMTEDALAIGESTSPRTLIFNNPYLRPFSVQAQVYQQTLGLPLNKPIVEIKRISLSEASTNLSLAHPNPFNPETLVAYEIAEPTTVSLIVYNVLGQQVRALVSEFQSPGSYQVTWDGRDDRNRPSSTGVYLLKMEAGTFQQTRKLLLMK